MIRSMTGYGRGSASMDGREITVEMKSVNHRYLDIGMRLPRHISFLEDVFRTELKNGLSRGHVELFVNYRNTRNDAKAIVIDEALLSQYLLSARAAGEKYSLPDDLALSNALRLPDVVDIVEAEEDRDAVVALATEAARRAIAEMVSMREVEGGRLRADLLEHLDEVQALTTRILSRAPLVVEEYRKKLNERVAQLLDETEVDRARLSTEIALFADKAGIDEEVVRLKSHVEQFRQTLSSGEPAGRKLDFIVQEINREFNTIGSKANDAELTNAVLAGKGEVEKLREQVQNVE